jgi:uncharacterized protein YhjY with autotransporter beta-barrel domain
MRSNRGIGFLLVLWLCVPLGAIAQGAPNNAIELLYVSGNSQSVAPYATLGAPLVTQLQPDANFDTTKPVSVDWQITSGQATIVESSGTSYTQVVNVPGGSSGAMPPPPTQIHIMAGATPGNVFVRAVCAVCQQFAATNPGLPYQQNFTFTIVQPPPPTLAIVSGDGQTGTTGSAAGAPLVVALSRGTAPLANQTVSWSVTSGQAVLSAATMQTDSNGHASINFSYGASAGPIAIQASAAGSQVTFNETATTPPPATLQIVSGDGQTGATASAAGAPLIVALTSGSTPVPNQTVNWSIASGQAMLSAATTQTDSNGQTSINFTFGASAGPLTIQASSASSQVTFAATAFTPATTALSGNNQTGMAGAALQAFVVQISAPSGSSGASLGQIPVTWTVLQGGGTLAAAQTLTDASGRSSNTLTLGSTPGTNVVQATVAGSGSVTFTATATNGVPSGATLSIVSGSGQALVPLTPSQPMVVKLADPSGQPLSGIDIQWSVSGSSGTLANVSTPTDANGQAQNQLTVVLPGSYTVTAQVANAPGIAAVTFGFNNAVANLSGLTPPEIAVAHAIDVACPALATTSTPLPPPQTDLLNRCSEIVVRSGTNPAQVPHALDEMLNSKSLPQRNLAQGVQLGQNTNLNTRLAQLRQGATGVNLGGLSLTEDGRNLPLAMFGDLFRKDPKQNDEVGTDFKRWGFFATGMIQRGGFSAVASNAQPGFDFHNASITAGIDYRFNADFVAGVALGYNSNHSSLDQNSGKVDVDGYSVNGYFTWYHNDFYLEGSAILGRLDYDLRRNINYQIDSLASSGGLTTINQTASASPGGDQNSLALSFGKDFNHQAWTFGPYVRGIYSHVNLDGFSETMSDPGAQGGGLGTSVEGRSATSELAVLGARVSHATSYDWGVLVPNALLEWNHEFNNDAHNVVSRFLADPTQTPIVLTDTPPDTNYFNIGIGLNAVLPKGRSGFVYLEHLAGYSGAHENRLSIGIRIEF